MWKQRTGDLENRWRSVDVEYSGMKEIVWGVWKERENMNADMKWLDNPEVFKVNQLESHSDHCYYLEDNIFRISLMLSVPINKVFFRKFIKYDITF